MNNQIWAAIGIFIGYIAVKYRKFSILPEEFNIIMGCILISTGILTYIFFNY